MRGCLSFLGKERDLGRYRTGVFVASAEQDVLERVLPILPEQFADVSFTFLAPRGYAELFSSATEVVWAEEIKASPVRSLRFLRRRRFDLCIVLFAGRPTYRKTKLAALLLNSRRTIIYNKDADWFCLDRAHWKTLLTHIGRRPHRRHLGPLLSSLGFLYLAGRTLWLSAGARLRVSGDRRTHETPANSATADPNPVLPGSEHLASTKVRTCPVCNTPCLQSGLIGSLQKTAGSKLSADTFDLTYCACGELIYISPLPTDDDFKTLYVVGKQFGQGSVYRDEERVKSALQYYEDRVRAMLSWSKRKHTGRAFLEIGAGLSWICRVAKKIDPEYKTVAQDVSAETVSECSWVDHYLVTDLMDTRIDELGQYDVISMTHVIEHLIDPVWTLRRAKDLLKPGGTIFITAPYRPIGWCPDDKDLNRWSAYTYNHVPAHLQYFSEQSLSKAASLAGLSLVYWNSQHETGQVFEAWLTDAGETTARDETRPLSRVAEAGPSNRDHVEVGQNSSTIWASLGSPNRSIQGVCSICGSRVQFRNVDPGNLREGLICPHCGAAGRDRFLIHVLSKCLGHREPLARWPQDKSIAIMETSGRRAHPSFLSEKFSYWNTEYNPEKIRLGIDPQKYADIQKLTFPDETFDCVLSAEVFEHVRREDLGFREVFRVLKPAGWFLLQVPYGHNIDTVIKVRPEGDKDIFLCPPQYHAEDTLVYRIYGRDLLQCLRDVGFAPAYIRTASTRMGISPQDMILCQKLPYIELGHWLEESSAWPAT